LERSSASNLHEKAFASMTDWRELDSAHVWHPFTPMSAYVAEHAPIIAAAEGFHLVDTAGRRYLDGHSSLWCNIHGHRVAAIDAALHDQLQRVAHSTLLGLSNVPSIELAAELVRRAPTGLTKVFYADCGAAGVEVALKMAYQFHRQKTRSEPRELFAGLMGAYHGDTVGTVSLGGIDRFHALFSGLMFPTLRVPSPATPGLSLDECLRQTESLLSQHAGNIAGFVVEPLVQAAAGILVHPPGYLRALRALTKDLGILLIADEIAVGFGRTGTLFACEQEGVSPDLLILSKGLTGGYLPLAATLATEEIYAAFLGEPWAGRTFFHGHTYTGNPLACAAALASLRLIEENRVLDNVQRIAELFSSEFHATDSWVQNRVLIRHKGAMLGLELLQDAQDLTPFSPQQRVGHQVVLECRRRGVIVRNIGDAIVLMPAPAMPLDLVVALCRTVRESIETVLAKCAAA
jgi:adenosylmethionine-8-amino-7-oxononanoate aminotransferase